MSFVIIIIVGAKNLKNNTGSEKPDKKEKEGETSKETLELKWHQIAKIAIINANSLSGAATSEVCIENKD